MYPRHHYYQDSWRLEHVLFCTSMPLMQYGVHNEFRKSEPDLRVVKIILVVGGADEEFYPGYDTGEASIIDLTEIFHQVAMPTVQ